MAAFFEDAADYDRLMARWSRAAAAAFLGWLDPAPGARWLDVGCGTGVVTAAIVERSRPASVTGVDVAPTLLARASERLRGSAALALADARSLPFPDRSFDVVVAALVLNFIAEPAQAIAEMKRVGRRGGLLGAVVWDYAGGRSPLAPLRAALGEIGVEPPPLPGEERCELAALRSLFARGGLAASDVTGFDLTIAFAGFDSWWRATAAAAGSTGHAVAALAPRRRARLRDLLRSRIVSGADGRVICAARAHAVKARLA